MCCGLFCVVLFGFGWFDVMCGLMDALLVWLFLVDLLCFTDYCYVNSVVVAILCWFGVWLL